MAVRIQTTSAARIAPQRDHVPVQCVWWCTAGRAAPSLQEGPRACGVCQERVSPVPKRVEEPHVFRKWCLPVGIHQDFGLPSTPAASRLYNPSSTDRVFLLVFAQRFLVRLQPSKHNGEGAEPKIPSPHNSSG